MHLTGAEGNVVKIFCPGTEFLGKLELKAVLDFDFPGRPSQRQNNVLEASEKCEQSCITLGKTGSLPRSSLYCLWPPFFLRMVI